MKTHALAAGSHRHGDSAAEIPAAGSGLPQLSTLALCIAPNRIHFLKFILEGYDGLAVLSTLDPQQGLVRVRFPAEVKDELLALLHDLGPQVGLVAQPETGHEV